MDYQDAKRIAHEAERAALASGRSRDAAVRVYVDRLAELIGHRHQIDRRAASPKVLAGIERDLSFSLPEAGSARITAAGPVFS
jgi:hypothetical protein